MVPRSGAIMRSQFRVAGGVRRSIGGRKIRTEGSAHFSGPCSSPHYGPVFRVLLHLDVSFSWFLAVLVWALSLARFTPCSSNSSFCLATVFLPVFAYRSGSYIIFRACRIHRLGVHSSLQRRRGYGYHLHLMRFVSTVYLVGVALPPASLLGFAFPFSSLTIVMFTGVCVVCNSILSQSTRSSTCSSLIHR